MKQGYSVVYREHDQVHPMAGGHFFPREELPALVDWLETQRRIHTPKKITIVRDRDHAGQSYWIRIDEIDPEVGSFWLSEQKPGETRHPGRGCLYARIDAKIVGEPHRSYRSACPPICCSSERSTGGYESTCPDRDEWS
jgi:hypothetical protein